MQHSAEQDASTVPPATDLAAGEPDSAAPAPASGAPARRAKHGRGDDPLIQRAVEAAQVREKAHADLMRETAGEMKRARRAEQEAAERPAPEATLPTLSPVHKIAEMRHDPSAIRRLFESGEYPYRSRMRTAPYEEHMLELQRELLKAQRWIEATGERVIVLFEGRDAAGKGGTIKRFTEHMNPRTARIVALQKPNERERTQWFFQRYVQHLPAAG